jgi:hypothetical protein
MANISTTSIQDEAALIKMNQLAKKRKSNQILIESDRVTSKKNPKFPKKFAKLQQETSLSNRSDAQLQSKNQTS